jgi:hypothetical protein
MFSPTHLKWYGLIAGVHGDYEGNFISKNVVDRLRLPSASVPPQSWADGVERPCVTATFTVARDQVSQHCLFHVVDNVDYDVCFGRAFVQEHRSRYTQLYNMMYQVSDGLYSNQLIMPPESSTDDSLLSPPSHSLTLSRRLEPLLENNVFEEEPFGDMAYSSGKPYSEEPWQEIHYYADAPEGVGLTPAVDQDDDIYDA